MKYYLKITTTVFYDPHGSADEGSIEKVVCSEYDCKGVTVDGTYIHILSYASYLENKGREEEIELLKGEYFLMPDDYEEVMEFCGQDGYNCEEPFYKFREISKDLYLDYLEIIGKYNDLK